MEWSKTFEFTAPLDRVWDAFTDRSHEGPWNHVFTGDPYFSGGRVQVTETERVDSGPERRLAWTEAAPNHEVQMTVTAVETETGARLTLTRYGFGEDAVRANLDEARLLGWVESIQDFALFLETGLRAQRHTPSGGGFRGLGLLGVSELETTAGVRALTVRDAGLASQAGMAAGDLFLALDGAPVFTRSDLWLFQRLLRTGQEVTLKFVHEGVVHEGRATVPEITWRGERRDA